MLVSQFKSKFLKSLEQEYPVEEINSFFYILTESILNLSRLDLALNTHKELSKVEVKSFEKAMLRLKDHEPIQYITGETEFFGLGFNVNKNVLIPRPETEELVQWILDDLKVKDLAAPSILDIGTGSGCIAVSLVKNIPNAKVTALDISEEALQVARANAEKNRVQVEFLQKDILSSAIPQKYDVIVSNPPYVRELEKQEMQRNVLENEPELALYVKNEDPLIFYRRITFLAATSLEKNGKLYFEINQYLDKETEQLLKENGFTTELKKDIFGNFRILKGEKI